MKWQPRSVLIAWDGALVVTKSSCTSTGAFFKMTSHIIVHLEYFMWWQDAHRSTLNLPWVGVHTKMLDVLQFLLGLVLSTVRCLMWFPLACRHTSHPTNILFVAHRCCDDEIKNTLFLSDVYCKDYYCKLSDLVNQEVTIACLLFCHQRPSVNYT